MKINGKGHKLLPTSFQLMTIHKISTVYELESVVPLDRKQAWDEVKRLRQLATNILTYPDKGCMFVGSLKALIEEKERRGL